MLTMAATHFTKTSIFNISKTNIRFSSLSFPQKASRVCFTPASIKSQAQHASEETNNIGYKMEQGIDKMKKGSEELKDTYINNMQQTNQNIKDKANETAADMKAKTDDIAEKTADTAGEMNNTVKAKADEIAEKTADTAGEMKNTVKAKSGDLKESVEEAASVTAEKAEEGGSKAVEMATAAKDEAIGAAETVAEKTKEAVAGAWDAAKETTDKIKETVVGSDEKKG